jgi:outer membrane protein TolC
MQVVYGFKGWKHWQRNGNRLELENPAWEATLAQYVDLNEAGAVELDVDSALRLAYMHSPFHQTQLETLYLSALDVTEERFRLDTQFFGGYDAVYDHNGSLIPPSLSFSPLLNRFVITPAIDGVENNRLTVGRPFGANPALQARRRFATAGELLVGFANSFVFEFTGGDANLATSLANFSFIQPLLRGAGKDVALEQLTFEERKLLANLRAYGQFRQGFYTQVAIGELGVNGPQRGGVGTNLQSFSGFGGVGGYLGLLQDLQRIRNARDNLRLQLRTRDRLEALLENDLIDLVQVDNFRQSVESAKSALLVQENSYELSLDQYKTQTLGLPPDLPIELDDSLIEQFQLVPVGVTEIQQKLTDLQGRVAGWPDSPDIDEMRSTLGELTDAIQPIWGLFDVVREDLDRMEEIVPTREAEMTEKEKERFLDDRVQLYRMLDELQEKFLEKEALLRDLQENLTEQSRATAATQFVSWIRDALQLAERLVLVPARARLETIIVNPVRLDPDAALQIALSNRLDFMNGRAALVDSWRLVQVNADALQSVLNVTANGDIRTARNNPLSFRAPTGRLRLGLEFDAPFTRLQERNAYRESLIRYQQNRRQYIQSRDRLQLGLRALLRNLEQLRQNLEIQRTAVSIAIRRVDQTQLSVNPPGPAPAPGSRLRINNTTVFELLSAQSSLLNSQNGFLAAWLNYYAERLRLYRELGVMQLDQEGRWMETSLPGTEEAVPRGLPAVPGMEALPPPPLVLDPWIDAADYAQPHGHPAGTVRPTSHSAPVLPSSKAPLPAVPIRRLPPPGTTRHN